MIDTCPTCRGHDIHHSRLRNWIERLRAKITRRVPYRCHTCDWRGWSEHAPMQQPADQAHRVLRRRISDEEIDHLDDGEPGSLT